MTSSFLKSIVKEIDNDYAGLLSEGGVGDIESFVDTGSYIFNALVSGSIYKGVPSNKITALAGESGTGKTFFCLGVIAQEHPQLIREISEKGHEIASHGWDHTIISEMSSNELEDDIKKSTEVLSKIF